MESVFLTTSKTFKYFIMKNSNLTKAKQEKNDEFYTQISDIEKELKHYKEHFRGKTVFLNCDDPQESSFWKYFELNFDFLGIKRLISSHYKNGEGAYCLEILGDSNGDGRIDAKDIKRTELKQNGDFRSDESIALLKQCDIVVTNPPFSLFREFISLLDEHKKQFLVVGSMNAITYKDCFKMIKEDKMWLGINNLKEFLQPDGTIKKFGNINWYTNLPHKKRNEEIILYKEYNETDYPKYDNYDAINVDKVKDIPKEYFKVVGVPITFLSNYNPEQFEIVGLLDGKYRIINGKNIYQRILIKRKQ